VIDLARRSTSASYYAVFHALTLDVVRQIAPQATADDRYRLTRSMHHRGMADVCRWIATNASAKEHVAPIVSQLRATHGNP
jgi:hypothetical protein